MKFLNLTLGTPAENLACDEVLLDLCEGAGVEVLRFWESRRHFVVVGYGNGVESEVNVEECKRRGVAILRRCSGGGTVVQGPGCLNYNLTLRIPEAGPLTTVTGTNKSVMDRNRAALEQLLGMKVSVQGHTDLAFAEVRSPVPIVPRIELTAQRHGEDTAPHLHWLKFSGNAQRRRRHALVFHGTILYAFDLPIINALLRFPSAQPKYRDGRGHTEFIRNAPTTPEEVRLALQSTWIANEAFTTVPRSQIAKLVADRYGNDEWNLRR